MDISTSLKVNLEQWEILLLLAAYLNKGHCFTEHMLLDALHDQPESLEKPVPLTSKESINLLDMSTPIPSPPATVPTEMPTNEMSEVVPANNPFNTTESEMSGMNIMYSQQQQAYMQMMMYYQMAGFQLTPMPYDTMNLSSSQALQGQEGGEDEKDEKEKEEQLQEMGEEMVESVVDRPSEPQEESPISNEQQQQQQQQQDGNNVEMTMEMSAEVTMEEPTSTHQVESIPEDNPLDQPSTVTPTLPVFPEPSTMSTLPEIEMTMPRLSFSDQPVQPVQPASLSPPPQATQSTQEVDSSVSSQESIHDCMFTEFTRFISRDEKGRYCMGSLHYSYSWGMQSSDNPERSYSCASHIGD